MKIYQYPRCSTCRKALKWLDAHAVPYVAVDIVQAPPTKAELARLLKLSGLPVNKLFNTSGQAYRDGNYKERLATMSSDQALAELSANGKLIKRPLLVADQFVLVGFQEPAYSSRF